jgi:hypothetical protein
MNSAPKGNRMRPNILMFMTDNQPAELLGCYGNAEIHTPHIDAFAADAFQFDVAFCVNGMCSPCRASAGIEPDGYNDNSAATSFTTSRTTRRKRLTLSANRNIRISQTS